MIELDFMKGDIKFKITDFITENGMPNKVILKNAYCLWEFCNNPRGNVENYYINIVLEDNINKTPINGKIGGYNRAKDYQSTYYNLTDLKKICTRDKVAISALELMLNRCAEAFKNNTLVPKGTKKEQMLEYLILNHLKTKKTPELENPIRIVLQDEDLKDTEYGKAHTYYITEVYIGEKDYSSM